MEAAEAVAVKMWAAEMMAAMSYMKFVLSGSVAFFMFCLGSLLHSFKKARSSMIIT